VLPVFAALVLATVLVPVADRLHGRRLPRSLAALAALLGSALVLGGVLAALAPAAIGELNDVDLSVQGGVEEVQEWLSKGPLGLSETRIGELVDRAQDELRARSGTIAGGALGGAVIALEVIAGVLLTIVLLFFFIRDGERLWRWIVGLAPEQNRRDVREIGMRAWDTLGGYLRGTAIVAFFDAALIGLALSLLGVPLALPLAVLTFSGAFVPLVGAVVAGFAAAMVALVSEGFFVALIVVGSSSSCSRSRGTCSSRSSWEKALELHPVAILLAVTAGAVVWGVIGAFLAVPLVAIVARTASYLRSRPSDQAEPPAGTPATNVWSGEKCGPRTARSAR
jgi:putative heme transporter